jgi:hypothetical protein
MTLMSRAPYVLLYLPLLLGGCEPERGIRSNRDYSSPVDVNCVDRTLRDTFGKVERWDYTSDGGNFPKGTQVVQIAYYQRPDGDGWATLEIGPVDGETRISHAFSGIGAELPQDAFPPAIAAMNKASDAVRNACRLDLSGMEMHEIGQDVDALN